VPAEATVVLVHGAWHGAWCWETVVRQLDAAGIVNVTVENPSVAHAPASLTDDVMNVHRTLDAFDGPVVLLGHSYGGAVVTGAGTHDAVRHIVYLTAFALDDGESMTENDLTGGEEMKVGDALEFDGDIIHFKPEFAFDICYNDCTPADAAAAAAQLKPMSLAAMTEPVSAVAWRAKPATYIVCTDDHLLPVALQDSNASRVGRRLEIPTSHSPFLSKPALVSEVLIELARG
jgi:pimeloyl-ACP methyl ester carboxylesterase